MYLRTPLDKIQSKEALETSGGGRPKIYLQSTARNGNALRSQAMQNGKLSRRSVLKGATAFAAPSLFPKLLKAAAPDPTAVSPALIEAARKEDAVTFYTAMQIPLSASAKKRRSAFTR